MPPSSKGSSRSAAEPPLASSAKRQRTVDFGSMSIRVGLPSKSEVLANVAAGQSALKRARRVFVGSGVALALKPSVPKYHVDPDQPGLIVQELNGKRRLGTLSNGVFKPSR